MNWERIKKWFKGLTTINKINKEPELLSESETKINYADNERNKAYQCYTVAELRRIILINYPPFTWEKVGLLLYKEFTHEGKSFTKLKDNDIIPPSLVECISNALYMFYKKELPRV